MSKLALVNRVPRAYDQAAIQEIVRLLETQGNKLAEGSIAARHGAMTAAPTAGTWVRGDIVDNSAPSVVSDAVADYVIVGWICTVSGTPGTWAERRVLVEGITAAPTLGAEVSASGTSITFTGIPAAARRIVIELEGVSTNGTSNPMVQLGDSGGIETTGYLSSAVILTNAAAVATAAFTTGIGISGAVSANTVLHGAITLTLKDSANDTWIGTCIMAGTDNSQITIGGGSKSLSAALDRVRLTTVGGADSFDAGSINILYD